MNKTGKIYKLYNQYGIYYGSTTKTLNRRLSNHKYEAKSKNVSSHILFQNGAIPKIELIEEVEFDDIKELRERERYYIKNLDCINKDIPGRTQKEYNLDNKDKIKKQQKEHYEQNKDKILQKKKEYYKRKKQQAEEVYDFLTQIENSNI